MLEVTGKYKKKINLIKKKKKVGKHLRIFSKNYELSLSLCGLIKTRRGQKSFVVSELVDSSIVKRLTEKTSCSQYSYTCIII